MKREAHFQSSTPSPQVRLNQLGQQCRADIDPLLSSGGSSCIIKVTLTNAGSEVYM